MALEAYQPTLMVLKFQHIRITWRLVKALVLGPPPPEFWRQVSLAWAGTS